MTSPIEADPLSLAVQLGRAHPGFVAAVTHLFGCPACVALHPISPAAYLAACVPAGNPEAIVDGVAHIAAVATAGAFAEDRNANAAVSTLYLILYVLWLARAGELRWPEAWGAGCPKMEPAGA